MMAPLKNIGSHNISWLDTFGDYIPVEQFIPTSNL
jgi:hypothetical protein